MLGFFVCIFVLFVFVLLGVMFITLLERKLLGYSQNRVGVNKVLFMGWLQPALDGFKLLLKDFMVVYEGDKLLFFVSPFILVVVMLFIWVLLDHYGCVGHGIGLLIFLSCLGGVIYASLFGGWVSNSKYSLLGSLRAASGAISYEVCLSFFLLVFFVLGGNSLSIMDVIFKENFFIFLFVSPILLCWVVCILGESSRAPFDFSEGESELVSGFNVEYGGAPFALLFIGEYGFVLFFSFVSSLLLIGSWGFVFLFVSLFLFIRSCFPRFRYDKFMMLAWKVLMPVSILWLFLCLLL